MHANKYHPPHTQIHTCVQPAEDAAQKSRRQAIEAMPQLAEHAPYGPPDSSERLDGYLYSDVKTQGNE
ncbi:MAG: hypothetical protein GX456_12675 [Verrucomicrobia bacterium]|nr:hypothetical protein [Verrucomicrobiota bacterium]